MYKWKKTNRKRLLIQVSIYVCMRRKRFVTQREWTDDGYSKRQVACIDRGQNDASGKMMR